MPGFAVDSHPQKLKIIDRILAGEPARHIADTCVPPVSFNAIQRYKTCVIKPMLRRAEESERILKGTPLVRGVIKIDTTAPQAVQEVKQAIIDAPSVSIFRQRLKYLQGEVDEALMRAKTAVRVVTDPDSGELVAVGSDVSCIAPILNQGHKNLEMLGRATGELEPIAGNAISIQIITPAATGELPRVSYASSDQIELDGGMEEIGLKQLG